jgi:hypothetical protein
MGIAVRRALGIVLLCVAALVPSAAVAQQSKTGTLAAEVIRLLETRKLDSIAARGAAPDEYVGALYFPGSQLLVVGAMYTSSARMDLLLGARQYREVYIDLNSASVPQTKVFISDLGANGLRSDRDGNQPFDTVELQGKSYAFNGEWGKAKMSRDEYTKVYQATDERYARMLEALLAELKKTS